MVEILSERNLNEPNNFFMRLSRKASDLYTLRGDVRDLINKYSTGYYQDLLNPIEDLIRNSYNFTYYDLLRGYLLTYYCGRPVIFFFHL